MEKKKRSLTAIAALALFAVFTASMLAVLLGGAKVYRGLTARDGRAYEQRTAVQYVTTRLRQSEGAGSVSVAPFGNSNALHITQDIAGTSYTTCVYCHDGWLRELFARSDGQFSPEDGEKVLPLQDFDPALKDGLFTAVLTEESGQTHRLYLHLDGEVSGP